jgi:hypothetical protein
MHGGGINLKIGVPWRMRMRTQQRCGDRLRPVAGCGRSAVSTRGAMSGSYSVAELDRIISDIFSFTKGGSASKAVLPEPEVCRLCDMAKEILQV